jgi:predicted Rossmann fold flavoprotein
MKIAIIGGGAAGFFAGIHAKMNNLDADVSIYERSAKVLGKVKISGGGRCNVTNACFDHKKLPAHYPRGENFLKKCFVQFGPKETMEWFENRGVAMHTYPDNHVFPKANDSQVIIDCFLNEARKLGVVVKTETAIDSVEQADGQFLMKGRDSDLLVDKVIVTIGGQPKRSGLEWIEKLGHRVVEPVPSLFTFNMPKNPIIELMGNVVEEATVKIEGSKLLGKGPLLITHWGMSGPAILQLSAWGARILEEKKYTFAILVNWLNEEKEQGLRNKIEDIKVAHGGKMITNLNPFPMTSRLWNHLLLRAEVNLEMRWKELGSKTLNRLVNTLINDRYEVEGKTTFKEEFVTAGGIPLSEIDHRTMESRVVPGLFFAGEVIDIDGITGGFNFQAAWTTGFIAGSNAAQIENI